MKCLLLLLLFPTFFTLSAQEVYINNFNYKYHTKDCKKVNKSYYPVQLKDALKNNYKPCKECNPPTEILIEEDTSKVQQQIITEIVQVDSAKEQRLIEYKKLFDKGLINEKEYENLKNNILLLNNAEKKTTKIYSKSSLQALQKKYKGELITGSLLLMGGIGTIGAGAWYRKNKAPNSFNSAVQNYKNNYILIFSSGAFVTGIGFVLDMVGLYDKIVYNNKSNTVSLGLANEGLGLAINFK